MLQREHSSANRCKTPIGSLPPADLLVGAAALLAVVLLLSAYAALPGLEVFGHDEVHYYADFNFKLGEDGRWLNFLLHDFLRSVPPGTWACLLLATAWVLFFRLALSLDFDVAYAALVASTILLAPPFVEQSLWPATTIPAVIVLLFAGLLVERGLPCSFIYLLCGILIFGSMQGFYFLLPIFFLGQFTTPMKAGERRWPMLIRHMSWWVVGAITGVLVMSCILWYKTGHFGVQPAEWRRTQPAHDLAGLTRNFLYVVDAFWRQTTQLLRVAGVNREWFLVCVGLATFLRSRALLTTCHALLLLAAVAAAFFAFSIPLAPIIQSRSLVALSVAVVLLVALGPGSSVTGRLLGALLLLSISHRFSTNGEAYIAEHKAETSYVYNKLQELIPGYPAGYTAIALYGSVGDGAPEARLFNNAPRMHSIVHALGVRDYRDCRQGFDTRCEKMSGKSPIATLPFARGRLLFSVGQGNIGEVQYLE